MFCESGTICFAVYNISDIFSDYSENVKTNLTHLAFKADDLDNYLVDTFGCEFSEYANKNAI